MPRFLTEADVQSLVGWDDMAEAIDVVERAYREKAAGRATCYPRATVQYPPEDGYYTDVTIRILPGIVPALDSAALRVYANHHERPVAERGPRVLDFVMADELLLYWRYGEGMRLAAIMADYWLMNIRTAAPTGVATRTLAREDSRVLGMIGAGRHAPWQALAVCAVRPIEEVRIFSPSARRERTAADLAGRLPGRPVVRAVDSAREAVEGADVVITVTNANRPVLDGAWLAPGAHVNVIARGEIDEATILRAERITCSWREQILRDTPDFRPVPQLIARGAIAESAFLDLWDAVADPARRRPRRDALTLFLSQGVGLWDAALGGWVYDRAVARGVGRMLSLAGDADAATAGTERSGS
ncbi:MAG: ornithine cyclodeaminase family protein [Candidatus Rokubacteria bacterium]|nr:ornithine cyclodeaminase family protein [Candidatus Rokubacteria bacterium]